MSKKKLSNKQTESVLGLMELIAAGRIITESLKDEPDKKKILECVLTIIAMDAARHGYKITLSKVK